MWSVIVTILTYVNQGMAVMKQNLLVVILVAVIILQNVQSVKKFFQYLCSQIPMTYPSQPQVLTYREQNEEDSSSCSDDLRRIRELQQQKADEMAKIAAAERKKKAEEERLRKNLAARHKNEMGGHLLGQNDSTDDVNDKNKNNSTRSRNSNQSSRPLRTGFNPMQPWSSTGGGGYRPQRRIVNRG